MPIPEEIQATDSTEESLISDSKIADYQILVNNKAASDSPDLLPNAGQIHAAIAMSKLLEKTRTIVRMVVGSFSGTVCDRSNYLAALKEAIDKNVEFKIIHIDDLNTDSLAYQELIKAKQNGKNISFHHASQEFVNKMTFNSLINHFAVFDDDKFRYEDDVKKYVAWFSFNDKKNASILLRTFDKEFLEVA